MTITPTVFSEPSRPGKVNEDYASVGSTAAVVLDGAGLPAVFRGGCSHSVRWYSKTLAKSLHKCLQDPSASVREALRRALQVTAAAHGPGCRLDQGSPSGTVAAWRICGPNLEYLVLGDASIVFAFNDGGVLEIVDNRLDELVTPLKQELLDRWEQTGEFVGDEAWLESHRRTAEILRNVPGGYWVCQVDPAAADEALHGTIPLATLRGVVLATDGAMRGVHLLSLHDLSHAVRDYLDGGAAELYGDIRAAENRMKHKFARPRIKPHDDMTVVAHTFSP